MGIRISTIVEFIANVLSDFGKFFGSDKSKEIIQVSVEILMLVAAVLDRFNTPLTSQEKREGVRFIAKFLKYTPPDLLQKIVELRKKSEFEKLDSADLDAVVGLAISSYVKTKQESAKTTGPARFTPPGD